VTDLLLRHPQLQQIKPHLLCLNLNGMTRNGDRNGKQILPIGQGELDLELLRTIRDSGYRGRIGILNHTNEDAEGRLLDNRDGLEWLVPQLDGKTPAAPPKLRTYTPSAPIKADASAPPAPAQKTDYWAVEDPKLREQLPLYQTIPAAKPAELTPANGWPAAEEYANWYRSHAGAGRRTIQEHAKPSSTRCSPARSGPEATPSASRSCST